MLQSCTCYLDGSHQVSAFHHTLNSFTVQLHPLLVIRHASRVIKRKKTLYWRMAFMHTPRAKKNRHPERRCFNDLTMFITFCLYFKSMPAYLNQDELQVTHSYCFSTICLLQSLSINPASPEFGFKDSSSNKHD